MNATYAKCNSSFFDSNNIVILYTKATLSYSIPQLTRCSSCFVQFTTLCVTFITPLFISCF